MLGTEDGELLALKRVSEMWGERLTEFVIEASRIRAGKGGRGERVSMWYGGGVLVWRLVVVDGTPWIDDMGPEDEHPQGERRTAFFTSREGSLSAWLLYWRWGVWKERGLGSWHHGGVL